MRWRDEADDLVDFGLRVAAVVCVAVLVFSTIAIVTTLTGDEPVYRPGSVPATSEAPPLSGTTGE